MSDIEFAIKASKKLEGLLADYFDAEGKGLREKVDSVAHELSTELVNKIRWIATVRNNLVHELGYDDVPEQADFHLSCEDALLELQQYAIGRTNIRTGKIFKSSESHMRDAKFYQAMRRYDKHGLPLHVTATIYISALGMPYYTLYGLTNVAIGTLISYLFILVVIRFWFSFKAIFIFGAIGWSAVIDLISRWLLAGFIDYGADTYYMSMILPGCFLLYCSYLLFTGRYKFLA